MNHSELADILDEDDGVDYIALSPEDLRELVDEFDRAAPKPVVPCGDFPYVPRVRAGLDEPWPSDNEPHHYHYKWAERPTSSVVGPLDQAVREEWLEQARNEAFHADDGLVVEGFDEETGAVFARKAEPVDLECDPWEPPEDVDEVRREIEKHAHRRSKPAFDLLFYADWGDDGE